MDNHLMFVCITADSKWISYAWIYVRANYCHVWFKKR